MSLYTIILIIFFFLMVAIIGGVMMAVMWLDKKIDKRDRLGDSAYRKKVKTTKSLSDEADRQ